MEEIREKRSGMKSGVPWRMRRRGGEAIAARDGSRRKMSFGTGNPGNFALPDKTSLSSKWDSAAYSNQP